MTDGLAPDADQLGAHVKRLNLWLDSESNESYQIETVRGNRWSLRYDLAVLLAEVRRLRDENEQLAKRIGDTRAEIRRQDPVGTGLISNILAAVETHLADPEYRPPADRNPAT